MLCHSLYIAHIKQIADLKVASQRLHSIFPSFFRNSRHLLNFGLHWETNDLSWGARYFSRRSHFCRGSWSLLVGWAGLRCDGHHAVISPSLSCSLALILQFWDRWLSLLLLNVLRATRAWSKRRLDSLGCKSDGCCIRNGAFCWFTCSRSFTLILLLSAARRLNISRLLRSRDRWSYLWVIRLDGCRLILHDWCLVGYGRCLANKSISFGRLTTAMALPLWNLNRFILSISIDLWISCIIHLRFKCLRRRNCMMFLLMVETTGKTRQVSRRSVGRLHCSPIRVALAVQNSAFELPDAIFCRAAWAVEAFRFYLAYRVG